MYQGRTYRPEPPSSDAYTVKAFNPPPGETAYQDWYSSNFEGLKKQYNLTKEYKEAVCRNIVLPAKRRGGPVSEEAMAKLVAWQASLDDYDRKSKEDQQKVSEIAQQLSTAQQEVRRLQSEETAAEDRKKNNDATKKRLAQDRYFLKLAQVKKQADEEAPEEVPTVLPFPKDYCYFLTRLLRAENAYLEQARHLSRYSRQGGTSFPIAITPTGQEAIIRIPGISTPEHVTLTPQRVLRIPEAVRVEERKELLRSRQAPQTPRESKPIERIPA
jgi:hypothetical protein